MKRTKFYIFLSSIVRPFYYLIYPYKVINADNVKSDKGFILVSNHLSITDPFYLILALKKYSIHFMAKVELFKNPIIRYIITKMGAFPVERGKGDRGTLDYAENLIKNGCVVGIFPEGTRSKDGKMGRAKSGAAVIAGATRSDVLPVHIIPKTDSGLVKPFHKTYIVFGDMISFEDLGIKDNVPAEYKQAGRYIMSKISELQIEDIKEG